MKHNLTRVWLVVLEEIEKGARARAHDGCSGKLSYLRGKSIKIHLDLGFDLASELSPLLVDAMKFDSHASDGLGTRPRPVGDSIFELKLPVNPQSATHLCSLRSRKPTIAS